MSASTIPAVKRALHDRLEQAAQLGGPLEGIQVSYGHPGADQLQKKCVYVGDARAEEQAAGMGPHTPRNESVTCELVVLAMRRPDSSELEVEDALWDLVTAARAAVYDDLDLGGVLVNPSGVRGTRQDSWVDPERGWVGRAVIEIGGIGRSNP